MSGVGRMWGGHGGIEGKRMGWRVGREEAGELCATWEESEGAERATSEMADVLYHSMVLMAKQVKKGEEDGKVV